MVNKAELEKQNEKEPNCNKWKLPDEFLFVLQYMNHEI